MTNYWKGDRFWPPSRSKWAAGIAAGVIPPFVVGPMGQQAPSGSKTMILVDTPDPAATERVVSHTTGQGTGDQAVFRWQCQVRAPLGAWPTTALAIDLWRDDATNVVFSLAIKDTTGATIATKTPTPAASTWETTTVTAAELAAGTYAQGAEFSVDLTVTLNAADNAYCTRPRAGA